MLVGSGVGYVSLSLFRDVGCVLAYGEVPCCGSGNRVFEGCCRGWAC